MVAEYTMMSEITHSLGHSGASRLVGETNINPKITLQNLQLRLS